MRVLLLLKMVLIPYCQKWSRIFKISCRKHLAQKQFGNLSHTCDCIYIYSRLNLSHTFLATPPKTFFLFMQHLIRRIWRTITMWIQLKQQKNFCNTIMNATPVFQEVAFFVVVEKFFRLSPISAFLLIKFPQQVNKPHAIK